MKIPLTDFGLNVEKKEITVASLSGNVIGYNERVSEDEKLVLVLDEDNLRYLILDSDLFKNSKDLSYYLSVNAKQFLKIERDETLKNAGL